MASLTSYGNGLVLVEKVQCVAVVMINRPDVRNCVNRPTADALSQAFRDFENDASLRVAVLHGAEGNFCAGADLKAVASGDLNVVNRVDIDGDGPMGPSRMFLSKPVIAAIEGYAVAGGLELAAWADLRVVSSDAIMGVFCRRWGVPLIDGGTVRLPRIIGFGRAMDLILTGRPIDANEALSMGFANRVVPKGQAKQTAIELALQISSFPQQCMLADRHSAYQQQDLSYKEVYFLMTW
eukprot:TRINITY_DN3975_c0_g1_i1.p1 TRINITY_DN3975_c0_g1~~TRINITY_DN3975_c0_g1_i1.p1  ORF type:complete len:238 (-),score=53.88 TRINITY_DN3975_c0_g1_i1:418-1131(-)